jgi:general stress protein CsbA
MWLIKLIITGISPQFGYGFVCGIVLTVVLVFSAEKLGYKEPRY